VLSFPTAKAIDTFHHRSLLNSHKACHHKTSRSPPHLLELVDVAHRGQLILAIIFVLSFAFSSSRCHSHCQWPSPGPQVLLKSTTSSCGLFGHTNQANDRPLLEHRSIKQQFREMASGRPQSPQAYNILCITGLSYLVSILAQTLAGGQPAYLLLVQGTGASEPKPSEDGKCHV
jgi:hypothetical protein